ncbi:MAG: DUF4034 domain-containing protein [Paracoccaceae bacterium]
MQILRFVLPLAMLVLAGQAVALSNEEARRLVREADFDTVEAAFAEHQAAFNAGEITPDEFESPYWAFRTTEPRVLELADAWLAARPDSPQALVAKAATLIHVAMVVRGNGFIRDTPRNSIAMMRGLYDEARPLLMRALDLEERQIFAADMIETAAPFLGDRSGEQRAVATLRQYDDPESIFFSDLHRLLPQWGGSEAAMRQFCRQETPRVEAVSEATCNAFVTLKMPGSSIDEIQAAIDTLAAEGDDRWVTTRAHALMRIHRERQALELYERNNYWIGWSDAEEIARALSDAALLKRLAERWLAINPYHPRHLAHLAWALDLEGDVAGAVRAADDSMRYGATIPEVRTARMFVIAKDEERKWGLLEEFEEAIAQTNAHADVTEMATAALYRPFPYLTHRKDGTPTPDFQCRRLRIFVQHAAACARIAGKTGTRRNCHPAGLQQVVMPILDEARRAGQCRDIHKKTWRQLVEEWLE